MEVTAHYCFSSFFSNFSIYGDYRLQGVYSVNLGLIKKNQDGEEGSIACFIKKILKSIDSGKRVWDYTNT